MLDHPAAVISAAALLATALFALGHHLAQPRTQEDPR